MEARVWYGNFTEFGPDFGTDEGFVRHGLRY